MKTAINFRNETVGITVMESLVVSTLNRCDQYDERPYIHIDDLCNNTGIEINQLRGVVSSLAQKDILEVNKDFFRKGDSIVVMYRQQDTA